MRHHHALAVIVTALSITPPASSPERAEIDRLRAALAELEERTQMLQEELDETNRGVVALYAELDDQAEQLRIAQRQSESKFRTIYAQATSGIVLVDADGRITEANPAFAVLLGVPLESLDGTRLRDHATPESAAQMDALARHAGAPLQRQEHMVRRPDGRLLHVEWSVIPEVGPGSAMLIATDVSQRIELERLRVQWLERERAARSEAEHGSRMKDDFIAVLAHELRTPLNAIVGWTQVLKARGGSDELVRAVAAIERNGTTQARMIADLLDMSRLRLGKLAMTFERVEPVAEVTAAVAALRPAFEDKGIAVAIVARDDLRPIRADASRLQQVVWNLLTNAIKFSPRGSAVRVTLDEDGDGVVVRVTDAGQGISAEFLGRVFDQFAQSDASTNRQRGGLGLGLAIVKQIVEAHGGAISVTSPGPGLGATFEVRLPFMPVVAEDVGEEAADDDAPLAGLDLLIVDDDDEATAMLAVILQDRGATVRAARDADAGLAQVAARRPAVLISDIGMPGKDGYELIRELRRDDATTGRHHLPAIALTSFAREQDRQQALAAGFDAHCAKPLRPLELVRQVRLLVEDTPG